MYITNLEVLERLFTIVGLFPILVILITTTVFMMYATAFNKLSDKYWAGFAFPYLIVVSITIFSYFGVYKGKHEILNYTKVVEGKYIGTTSDGSVSTYYLTDKTIYRPNSKLIFANAIIPFFVGIFLLVILFDLKRTPDRQIKILFIGLSLLLFIKSFSMIYFGVSFLNLQQDKQRVTDHPAFERVIIDRKGESLPIIITEEDKSYEFLDENEEK